MLKLVALALALAAAAPALAQEFKPFPDRYYYPNVKRDQPPRLIEGMPVPELAVRDWTTKAPGKGDLNGKVVLIDFWATWCPPCRAALPHNVELWNEHKDDGLVIIGIHDSRRGSERMQQIMAENKVTYPNAIDEGGKSVKAFGVRFWPTYVAVDHKGIVRAAGLSPLGVSEVVDALLKERAEDLEDVGDEAPEPADDEATASIPEDWLEGDKGRRNRLADLHGADSPPALEVTGWINAEATALEDLRGKVVMLHFWSPKRDACLRAIERNNELAEEHAGDGLVLIGICHTGAAAVLAEAVGSHAISYPVCADAEGATFASYQVDDLPDVYFIDRSGVLRVADAREDHVGEIVEALLAEPAPESATETAAN